MTTEVTLLSAPSSDWAGGLEPVPLSDTRTYEVSWSGHTWRGNYLDESGVKWYVRSDEGWRSSSGVRTARAPRPFRHGSFRAPSYREERIVTLSGEAVAPTTRERDRAANRLASLFADGVTMGTLLVADTAHTLQSTCQLDADVKIAPQTPISFQYQLPLACPDPVRYAATARASSAPLPVEGSGGITVPITVPITAGSLATGGRLYVSNYGTAPVWPFFEVEGPAPGPVITLDRTGQRLAFEEAFLVDAGQVLELDSHTRTVLLQGSASRRHRMTDAEWFELPPESTSLIRFTAASYEPGALLRVRWRSGWW